MPRGVHKLNINLLIAGFIIDNFLWIKAIIDIFNFQNIRSNFSFTPIFIFLFIIGVLLNIALSIYCIKGIHKSHDYNRIRIDPWIILIWLAIPISVLFTSLVCYEGSIFNTPYIASTIIRVSLLIIPIIAAILYFRGNKKVGILILLCLSLFLLIPNDKCYNPFNHWWIDHIGASPLTYLPVMFVLLYSITGFYGENKYLVTVIVYGLSFAALFISIGHRIKFLW